MLNTAHEHVNVSTEQKEHIPAGRKHRRPDAPPSAMDLRPVLLEEEPGCIIVARESVHLALLCAHVDRHCVGRIDRQSVRPWEQSPSARSGFMAE